ncbi:DUF3592 domain-containing protein [Hymenobacter armeniacus]|uniref:DUF3592 domain-containing protein n=1 Tax=Hymenobacter armeniacus TaxID=2771358 RepID=A0ABR8JZY9_9BACT|nr:DUF3592 domain-containing protein [Hymenobacter armeniacus]MBD2723414.1 DUF3592 domain-containing protein [Hymenobacter armeniacus]
MAWLAVVFACIPGSVAYAVLAEIRLASELSRNGIEQEGVIISQREVARSRSGSYYVPKVRFTTRNGEVVEGESAGLERFLDARHLFFADKVEFFDNDYALLRYDAANPRRFLFIQELDQTKNHWLLVITSLLTVVMVLAGLGPV